MSLILLCGRDDFKSFSCILLKFVLGHVAEKTMADYCDLSHFMLLILSCGRVHPPSPKIAD